MNHMRSFFHASVVLQLRNEPGLAHDSVPDFFHLRVQGVQRLVDEYGQSSQQLHDAMTMLEEVIDQVGSHTHGTPRCRVFAAINHCPVVPWRPL